MGYKVYKLTSPNGRVYVGCTAMPLDHRWSNGRGYINNEELYADILYYGWRSFKKEIIHEYEDEQLARDKEHSEIQNYPDGYNIYRGIKGYQPTGNPVTPSKPVRCIETGTIYDSIKSAARATGLAANKISYCCRGMRNKTGNLHWEFVK